MNSLPEEREANAESFETQEELKSCSTSEADVSPPQKPLVALKPSVSFIGLHCGAFCGPTFSLAQSLTNQ